MQLQLFLITLASSTWSSRGFAFHSLGHQQCLRRSAFETKQICKHRAYFAGFYSAGERSAQSFSLNASPSTSTNNSKNNAQSQHDGIHPDYRRDPSDVTTADDKNDINVEAIQDMLRIRDKARLRKDFDLADEILAELQQDHGVFVVDDKRMWTSRFKVDGQFSIEYQRDPDDADAPNLDVKAVQDLLNIRDKARRKRDFQLADELRDELIEGYGVYVNDVLRSWSTTPPWQQVSSRHHLIESSSSELVKKQPIEVTKSKRPRRPLKMQVRLTTMVYYIDTLER